MLYDYCLKHGRPDLLSQWHTARNGTATPKTQPSGSNRKVWWLCEKGHAWQARVSSRAGDDTGCPVCAGKIIIPGENDLAGAFPAVAAQWHPEKNGNLTPEMVSPYSNRKTWWLCEQGHAYHSVISSRTAGKGCPYCTGTKVLAGFNDLATREPELAAQWHPELNGELTPEMVSTGSHKKVWWRCALGHSWQCRVYTRAGKQRSGCPVCAGRVREDKQAHYDAMPAMGNGITSARADLI